MAILCGETGGWSSSLALRASAGPEAAMSLAVQTKETQPLSKTWELSFYESQRTPQEAITDGLEIAVSPRSLHSELMCPICLDLMKKTRTTKECLHHRFFADCIITAHLRGNKLCPTCRRKLVSKRSLKTDPNFDLSLCFHLCLETLYVSKFHSHSFYRRQTHLHFKT